MISSKLHDFAVKVHPGDRCLAVDGEWKGANRSRHQTGWSIGDSHLPKMSGKNRSAWIATRGINRLAYDSPEGLLDLDLLSMPGGVVIDSAIGLMMFDAGAIH